MSDFSFSAIHRSIQQRARLRSEWLGSLPEGHPMRVLATLQNTAACYLSRQAPSDTIDLQRAIAAAKEIEEEAFAQWRKAQP